MKRKINGQLLLFSALLLLLGIVLLGALFRMEHGADSGFQPYFYSTKSSVYNVRLRNMGMQGYLGLLAFCLIAFGCYGISKGLQGKEYRFRQKDWQVLDAEKMEQTEKGKLICPYCENTVTKKETYCPICGRKL